MEALLQGEGVGLVGHEHGVSDVGNMFEKGLKACLDRSSQRRWRITWVSFLGLGVSSRNLKGDFAGPAMQEALPLLDPVDVHSRL